MTKQGFALIPGHYRSVDDSKCLETYPAEKQIIHEGFPDLNVQPLG